MFCGKKGSGKSRLFLECLLNENGYRNKYHEIVIVSPTFRAQFEGLWSKLSPLGIKVHDEITEGLLTELISQQEHNDTNILVVFDDNGEIFKHIPQSSLNLFISNSRHLRLSCVFLAQKLSQLSTIIRANADVFVCFSACSFIELSALWKEVSVVERKRFLEIFKETTKEPYCFLVISMIAGKICFYKNAREQLDV